MANDRSTQIEGLKHLPANTYFSTDLRDGDVLDLLVLVEVELLGQVLVLLEAVAQRQHVSVAPTVHLGDGLREMWDVVGELVADTREWESGSWSKM